jgi:hypothetical protein
LILDSADTPMDSSRSASAPPGYWRPIRTGTAFSVCFL